MSSGGKISCGTLQIHLSLGWQQKTPFYTPWENRQQVRPGEVNGPKASKKRIGESGGSVTDPNLRINRRDLEKEKSGGGGGWAEEFPRGGPAGHRNRGGVAQERSEHKTNKQPGPGIKKAGKKTQSSKGRRRPRRRGEGDKTRLKLTKDSSRQKYIAAHTKEGLCARRFLPDTR